MDELKKSLERAYSMISTIPVTGDAVDRMTAARAELRRAFSMVKDEQAKEDTNGR